jgi:hypothetical protein
MGDERVEVIPLTTLGSRVVQLKQYEQLTDPECYYDIWCESYIQLSPDIKYGWNMPRSRIPFSNEKDRRNHLLIVEKFCQELTLADLKKSINSLTRYWDVKNVPEKLQSNYLYHLSWFILYLYMTQKGIPWTYYESVVKKANEIGMIYNNLQRGLHSLLFYDPWGLLQMRNEMIIGLCRMQPFFNYIMERAINEGWTISYTQTDRTERSNTDETKILYSVSKLMLSWLDLAMRLTNIPWRSLQLQSMILWEPKHTRDTLKRQESSDVPLLFLGIADDKYQYIRQWKVKDGITRKEFVGKPISYSLGETISGYMWFFWEYGYLAHTRPRKAFFNDHDTMFTLDDTDQPDDTMEYPKLFQDGRGKKLTSSLREFIIGYLGLSPASLRLLEIHGTNLALLLQHVVLASYTCRVSPYEWKSTQLHAWAHMNDLTLGISDKFHQFWKTHYQQVRGFKHVVNVLGNGNQYDTWYDEEEDQHVWVDLTPFEEPLRGLLQEGMRQTIHSQSLFTELQEEL